MSWQRVPCFTLLLLGRCYSFRMALGKGAAGGMGAGQPAMRRRAGWQQDCQLHNCGQAHVCFALVLNGVHTADRALPLALFRLIQVAVARTYRSCTTQPTCTARGTRWAHAAVGTGCLVRHAAASRTVFPGCCFEVGDVVWRSAARHGNRCCSSNRPCLDG